MQKALLHLPLIRRQRRVTQIKPAMLSSNVGGNIGLELYSLLNDFWLVMCVAPTANNSTRSHNARSTVSICAPRLYSSLLLSSVCLRLLAATILFNMIWFRKPDFRDLEIVEPLEYIEFRHPFTCKQVTASCHTRRMHTTQHVLSSCNGAHIRHHTNANSNFGNREKLHHLFQCNTARI